MDDTLGILFAGDVFIDKSVSDIHVGSELNRKIRTSDISCANFEGSLGSETPIDKSGPHLEQNRIAPSIMESIGFDVVSLANNHVWDFGDIGLQKTIDSFSTDTQVCGAGMAFDEAYKGLTMNSNDISVGFLSFSEAQFRAYIEQEDRGGYAWINHPSVEDRVRSAHRDNDVLIIQVHAGVELLDVPLPEWRQIYRKLIDYGADTVVGHHPHVPQGWEIYNQCPIFYSLGNFFFSKNDISDREQEGLIIELLLRQNNIVDFDINTIEFRKNKIELTEKLSSNKMLTELCNLLSEELYMKYVQNKCIDLYETRYKNYYHQAANGITDDVPTSTGIKRILKYFLSKTGIINIGVDNTLTLHNIRIESHRWTVQRAIESKLSRKYSQSNYPKSKGFNTD